MDLVIDIQCFHIFPSLEERRRVAGLMYRCGDASFDTPPPHSGVCVCISICSFVHHTHVGPVGCFARGGLRWS